MLEYNYTLCCGLKELHGIQHPTSGMFKDPIPSPLNVIEYLKDTMELDEDEGGEEPAGIIHFTQSNDAEYVQRGVDKAGDNLAEYIRANKLGRVVSLSNKNPNSGNTIKTFLWKVNLKRLAAFDAWQSTPA